MQKSKEYTLFMNLFWKAMSIMHRVKQAILLVYWTLFSQKSWFWLKKSQPYLRNSYLLDLAEKILNTVVNGLNFSISFELLIVEKF